MDVDRWSPERDPTVLGVVVHGPAMVARSEGIGVAVRCILASPGGLEIDLVLRAAGVQAEAASRQTFDDHLDRPDPDAEGGRWRGGSEPAVLIRVGGRQAAVHPHEQTSSGGTDTFASEWRVTVGELPSDGSITLTASWPQAGLAEDSVTLTLKSLDHLEERILRLPF